MQTISVDRVTASKEREYGTPVYREMFTILDEWMEPIIEIRRNPKSQRGVQQFGVLDPDACHVRLTNRTCYYAEPVKFLQEFIERHGLRISESAVSTFV